jgi:hypothetical protein
MMVDPGSLLAFLHESVRVANEVKAYGKPHLAAIANHLTLFAW